jgi:hypothetical protein
MFGVGYDFLETAFFQENDVSKVRIINDAVL